jgi:hypothetical protein
LARSASCSQLAQHRQCRSHLRRCPATLARFRPFSIIITIIIRMYVGIAIIITTTIAAITITTSDVDLAAVTIECSVRGLA